MLGVNIGSTFARDADVKTMSPVGFDGNTLYVGGSGPNNYTSIQSAIDDALDGDTVFVYVRTYPYFENLIIDKSIDLIGQDKNATLIDGEDNGNVIIVYADFVNISGFFIKGDDWGIDSQGNNNVISDNNVFSRLGIRINAKYNHVSNNLLDDGEIGIGLGGDGFNYISGNVIKSHISGGISLTESNDNIISENTIMNYGIAESYIGDIWIVVSNRNIISDNTLIAINDGSRYGIYTELEGSYNIIENNTFNGYRGYGIRGGDHGVVRYNDFIDCGTGLLWWFGPNIIYNNFINCNLGITLSRSNGGNIEDFE